MKIYKCSDCCRESICIKEGKCKCKKSPYYKRKYPQWADVIIKSSNWKMQDIKRIFGDDKGEIYNSIDLIDSEDISDLLVQLGVFSSKSRARKNKKEGKIPKGYTHNYKVTQNFRLFIWNPI